MRRAFTLTEVMMTIGVTVAIAALAMPLYLPLLQRQEFDGAVDQALAQCTQARAEAQHRGMALELVVSSGGNRLEVRPVNVLADAEDDPSAQAPAGGDGMERALRGSAAARALGDEMERRMERISQGVVRDRQSARQEWSQPWAQLDLTAGITASVDNPLENSDDRAGTSDAGTEPAPDTRVALFLPDGSAVATRGFWMTSNGRSVQVCIDPLLGHAHRSDLGR